MKKAIVMWAAFGAAYVAIELLWRGYSHPLMFVVGGLCGVLVGVVNQVPGFYRLPIIAQSLIGALIVLAVEFISGCILNLWLGLGVWDYSGWWSNVFGQVCPAYGLLWMLLMPQAIWMEDTMHSVIYYAGFGNDRPTIVEYSLISIYADLFMLR